MRSTLLTLILPFAAAELHFSEEASKRGVASGGHSFAVAYADVDADGDLDMFVTNSESANRLYINIDGKGKFEDQTTAAGIDPAAKKTSRGAVFADVDGDGNVDLYVTDSSNPNTLYMGDGKGQFKDMSAAAGVQDSGKFGQGACSADVNGDGHLDLFVANFGQANTLYVNKGNGIFDDATLTSGLTDAGIDSFGCAFGDVDEDGDLDLYVTNAGSYNKLYTNNGKGVFTDITEKAGVKADKGQGRGVSFADLNGDGHLDLYMVAPMSKNFLYLGDGTGRFTDGSDEAGVGDKGPAQGMNIADIDGDGDLDIFVSNILSAGILYINDGTGHFADKTREAGADWHLFGQGVAFGDVDEDGSLDMYIDTWGTPPAGWPSQSNKLLINQDKVSSWLKVKPVTKDGHATLFGSEVRVFEAGTSKPVGVRMQVDGGSGFASQNAYDVYFGLSKAVAAGVQKFDVEVLCRVGISPPPRVMLKGVTSNQLLKVACPKPMAKNVVV